MGWEQHLRAADQITEPDMPSPWVGGAGVSDPDMLADIAQSARSMIVAELAKQHVRTLQAAQLWTPPPYRLTLAEELAVPEEPIEWSILGLHEKGHNALIAALHKAGKTTLAKNLLKSLVDGQPFLGRFPVAPNAGRVGWLNFELSEPTARRWLRDMKFQRKAQVSVLHLRGRRLPLSLPAAVDWLVDWATNGDIKTLVIDPFGAAFAGEGSENSNDDVRLWLGRWDEIKLRAGIDNLFLVAHMGREKHEPGHEHVRGATVLDDWADTRWVYTKDGDDRYRYLKVSGRIDNPPDDLQLGYDSLTRRLSVVTEGPRWKIKHERHVQAYIDAVKANPSVNKKDLDDLVPCSQNDRKLAYEEACRRGVVVTGPDGQEWKNGDKKHHRFEAVNSGTGDGTPSWEIP